MAKPKGAAVAEMADLRRQLADAVARETSCREEIAGLVRRVAELESRAQDAHRAKDQFLASLGHELRTPLTPILISAGLNAGDPKLSDRVRSQFETIRSNVRQEARLLDGLLGQAETESGKIRLEKKLVDAHAVVKDALASVAGDFKAKGIESKVLLNARISQVDADPIRLQQIVGSLLRNAAEFAGAGGSVKIQTSTPAGNRLAITVSDSGPPRQAGDLGRDLGMARQLVELHDGTIEVGGSARGKNAAFTVTLPLPAGTAGRAEKSGKARRAANAGSGTKSKMRQVLLVEDHASTRAALKVLLGRHGYQISEAGSVSEALGMAGGQRFDILVSDLGLPDGTGHDVVREMKRAEPGLPAVALSGFGLESDVHDALAAGFSVHLTKPVGVEQLDAVLANFERQLAAG